jgi:hypothetical protein
VIDLRLKMLVWQDAAQKVLLSYNSSAYLEQRHEIPHDLLQNIAVDRPTALCRSRPRAIGTLNELAATLQRQEAKGL